MLAARRRAKGLSQAELAVRIGVSRPTVIALERDLGATVETVVKAAKLLGIGPLLRGPAFRRGGLVPATNAPAQDLVMTPPELAASVIGHFAGWMTGRVLDPARGQRAFHDGFPAHLDRHWCEIGEGRDFFDWRQPVDWVMTNPPWSRLREFTLHAMRIAPNIVWLAPLTNLTTKARLRDLDEVGSASSNWCGSRPPRIGHRVAFSWSQLGCAKGMRAAGCVAAGCIAGQHCRAAGGLCPADPGRSDLREIPARHAEEADGPHLLGSESAMPLR
ncbi:hypothetical protein DPM13_14885 [Paracoccus mutanolyticus]|uniref:HTH cro/C1-type domain-containing protein n=2 Tax=Paracoccus mutanolyticus TaxID=1499308 RepID=A0ABM6WVC6_9RHOB|nr:hypothetical protein DPM13_14885 [Paracoccus mutanolyticus]